MSETDDFVAESLREIGYQLAGWQLKLAEALTHRAYVMGALHKLREHSGLTLREAARRAGVSAATLSLAERLELDLSPEAANRVLAVYRELAASRRSPGEE